MGIYFVFELQSTDTGAAIPKAFTNKEAALAEFYRLASVAVKSEVKVHTVMCVNSYGFDVVDPVMFEHIEQDVLEK